MIHHRVPGSNEQDPSSRRHKVQLWCDDTMHTHNQIIVTSTCINFPERSHHSLPVYAGKLLISNSPADLGEVRWMLRRVIFFSTATGPLGPRAFSGYTAAPSVLYRQEVELKQKARNWRTKQYKTLLDMVANHKHPSRPKAPQIRRPDARRRRGAAACHRRPYVE